MAKRTKSALKANRQNVKRREHNRQMRSRLRTSLKAIRPSLDANDVDGAKTALSETVFGPSMILSARVGSGKLLAFVTSG